VLPAHGLTVVLVVVVVVVLVVVLVVVALTQYVLSSLVVPVLE
jgi:hypothetical protein